MTQKLKTKSIIRNWLLLMHSDVSLMYFGVLLNAFGCVLMISDHLLIASDDN